ncbi:MAG: VOC family protein [Caulobacteraceae bacterium]
MIEGLDHVAVAVSDLDAAGAGFEALLGRPPDWREEAAGARHAWFQLGNMALDLVQPEGPGESGDRVRARLADGGDGLWGLAFAVDDLAETRRVLARRALPSHEPALLLSTDAWRLAFLEAAATHGVPIALAERTAPPRRMPPFAPEAVHDLDHLMIRTDHCDRAIALYGARLGLDFRLERANPDWGARLAFFRCGGTVLEIASEIAPSAEAGSDRLSGLAWRVRDPAAAHGRLARAGLDLSEIRAGRKPGTRVFTVRSGVVGAPVLMLGEDSGP